MARGDRAAPGAGNGVSDPSPDPRKGRPSPVEIRAPLSGVIIPLDSVPDPVFARKMMGDGVAIDPTSSEVLAPISGQVTQLHRAHHALAITSDDGVEVLIHVGLDTVSLEGAGFTPLVSQGTRVERGDPVLRFDADAVARRARSLITPVVVTSGERVARLARAGGLAVAGTSALMQLELAAGGPAREPEAGDVEDGLDLVARNWCVEERTYAASCDERPVDGSTHVVEGSKRWRG